MSSKSYVTAFAQSLLHSQFIWVTLMDGTLLRLNHHEQTIHSVFVVSTFRLTKIVVGNPNLLWIGGTDGSIYCMKENRMNTKGKPSREEARIKQASMSTKLDLDWSKYSPVCGYAGPDGVLWIAMKSGLCMRFVPESERTPQVPRRNSRPMRGDAIETGTAQQRLSIAISSHLSATPIVYRQQSSADRPGLSSSNLSSPQSSSFSISLLALDRIGSSQKVKKGKGKTHKDDEEAEKDSGDEYEMGRSESTKGKMKEQGELADEAEEEKTAHTEIEERTRKEEAERHQKEEAERHQKEEEESRQKEEDRRIAREILQYEERLRMEEEERAVKELAAEDEKIRQDELEWEREEELCRASERTREEMI
ncbi:hypothetical protein BLNAU_22301 [Blattamonas nauphoetae]|uniref:Uncharacterized protein n=1 Tax=Blattamonas nauphoetae TaxID=2049346 RepID=A0ABQ9WTY8_9EUKA|nr:hypothetical protein BLNAU_22301 [Blattamonas nauphoetae]